MTFRERETHLSAEKFLDQTLHLGDTCRTTDQDDLVNVSLLQLSVFQNLLYGFHGGAEQILKTRNTET